MVVFTHWPPTIMQSMVPTAFPFSAMALLKLAVWSPMTRFTLIPYCFSKSMLASLK